MVQNFAQFIQSSVKKYFCLRRNDRFVENLCCLLEHNAHTFPAWIRREIPLGPLALVPARDGKWRTKLFLCQPRWRRRRVIDIPLPCKVDHANASFENGRRGKKDENRRSCSRNTFNSKEGGRGGNNPVGFSTDKSKKEEVKKRGKEEGFYSPFFHSSFPCTQL